MTRAEQKENEKIKKSFLIASLIFMFAAVASLTYAVVIDTRYENLKENILEHDGTLRELKQEVERY
jgi:hypothetical protein